VVHKVDRQFKHAETEGHQDHVRGYDPAARDGSTFLPATRVHVDNL
jgi:hypothetical protein